MPIVSDKEIIAVIKKHQTVKKTEIHVLRELR
jgi:hypothetical protein